MATRAQIFANISGVVDVLYGSLLRSPTLIPSINAYVGSAAANLIGSRAADGGAALKALRTQFADLVPGFQSVLDPHIFDLQEETGYKQIGSIDAEWWEFLRDDMVVNALSVKERNLTIPASGAPNGGNVGNGTLHVMSTDFRDRTRENVDLAKYLAICTVDQNQGAGVGQETFELSQTPTQEDVLDPSGGIGEVSALTGISGDQILTNHSFQTLSAAPAAPTEIFGWDYDGDPAAELEFDLTDFYRLSPEEDAFNQGASLRMKPGGGNRTLSQDLRQRNAAFSEDEPVIAAIALRGDLGNPTGTGELFLGSTSLPIPDISAIPVGWSVFFLPLDKGVLSRDFNAQPLQFGFRANVLSGYLSVDTAILSSFTLYQGLWFAMLGGPVASLQRDEYVVLVDLAATEAKFQLVMYVVYGEYLHHLAVPTIPDP